MQLNGTNLENDYIKQNAFLNAIMNNSLNVIIFLLDDNYRYLEFNENHRKEIKALYNRDIQINQSILDVIDSPSERDILKSSIDRALNGDSFVDSHIHENTNSYFEFHWNTVRKEGEIFGASCFKINISKRKKAEVKALKAKTEWETIFNGMPHPTVILDSNHNILSVNKKTLMKSGMTEESMKKLKCWQVFHRPGTICPPERCPFEKMVKENNDGTYESEMEAFGGYYMVSCTPILDDDGKLEKVIHIATDITERKNAENRLSKSEKKYRDLIENSLIGVYTSNLEGEFIFANKALCNMLGYESFEELQRTNAKQFYYDMEFRNKFIDDIISKGVLENFELDMKTKNGKVINTIINSVLTDNNISGMILDITTRKQYERELKKAKADAEESNRIKTAFLSNMSHELRTPMVAILGFADLLYEQLPESEEKYFTEMILKGGKRLNKTLNMILDLSRIESSKLEMDLRTENLSELVHSTFLLYEQEAKSKKIEFIEDYGRDVYSFADVNMVEKILDNLIQNAINYTNRGEIRILTGNEDIDGIPYAFVEVKDTGIGIQEKMLDVIFEPFRQASEGYSRKYEGTGLGLSITKKYVEHMNGKITVKSSLGKGSSFKVFLPKFELENVKEKLTEEENTEPERKGKLRFNGKKILVVEDDIYSLKMISFTLNDICDYEIVNSGEDAVRICSKKQFSMILLDIGLKGINGIEAMRQIKMIDGYKKTPFVALTAFAMSGDREKFIQAGCSDYVSKPFKKIDLQKTIFNTLNKL